MIEQVRGDGETYDDLDRNCFEKSLQLPRKKLDRGGERGNIAVGVGCCIIVI